MNHYAGRAPITVVVLGGLIGCDCVHVRAPMGALLMGSPIQVGRYAIIWACTFPLYCGHVLVVMGGGRLVRCTSSSS